MRSRPLLILFAFVVLTNAACMQNQGMYRWGSYEDDLVDLYKNPGKEREFAETLKTILDESRNEGVPAPPGIAAEYAFINYQAGNKKVAIEYFDIERKSWPESAGLMTKLIERISEEAETDATEPEAAESVEGSAVEESDRDTGETEEADPGTAQAGQS